MAYGALQSPPGDGRRGATLRSLQCLLLLAFLVLASVIGVTASDAASNDDGVAVTEKGSMDEPSSASDLAVREDGEADAQSEEARNDSLLRPEDEGQLLSNVELKTVSRHNVDKKKGPERSQVTSPGATGTSTPTEAKGSDKARSAADEEKEAREREKYKEIYGKAAKEAAETARGQAHSPKSERYHRLIGPTSQDAEYKKLQEELAKKSPEEREKLIEKRRKEEQEKKDTRSKYDEVLQELKQKLKEREEHKPAPPKPGRPRSKTI